MAPQCMRRPEGLRCSVAPAHLQSDAGASVLHHDRRRGHRPPANPASVRGHPLSPPSLTESQGREDLIEDRAGCLKGVPIDTGVDCPEITRRLREGSSWLDEGRRAGVSAASWQSVPSDSTASDRVVRYHLRRYIRFVEQLFPHVAQVLQVNQLR